ncbi:MAG: hypothetical protein CMF70_07800 [Magnetovibrio sp.]|nr:hypothetical protein [Magnetovibrio sp.]
MPKSILRFVLGLILLKTVSACTVIESDLFSADFWSQSPFRENTNAEMGIAALAKGNFVTAEGYFKKALGKDPRDVEALLGAGILYQNTGQIVKARQMYEAVLALHPDESLQFVVWNTLTTRPISQIASVNLSLLDTGGTPSTMAGAPPTAPLGKIGGETKTAPVLGRNSLNSVGSLSRLGDDAQSIGKFTGKDSNIMSRFSTLRALRDQGLLTPQEFAARRQANIGALLPLTSPPPAAGLGRPVPTTEQISARLRAIGRALGMRAISASQHANERAMIVDALMPSSPVIVAEPGLPPKGLMEAADAVRRLEQLRDNGYISSDEYSRERQAIELTVSPVSGVSRLGSKGKAKKLAGRKLPLSSPQPAIHLASFRSKNKAENGWKKIKRSHGKVIGKLGHKVARVDLGKKGIYYRLKVGPFSTVKRAEAVCKKLKRRGQFCQPTVMNSG